MVTVPAAPPKMAKASAGWRMDVTEPVAFVQFAWPALQVSVPLYELIIPQSTLDLFTADPYAPEQPATFRFNGTSIPVKVELRGASARFFPKKSWNLDFEDRRFQGRRRIALIAEYQDCTMMTEKLAYDLLPDGVKGSIVVMEPKTGNILAMVSKPSFDPNQLAGHNTDDVAANMERSSKTIQSQFASIIQEEMADLNQSLTAVIEGHAMNERHVLVSTLKSGGAARTWTLEGVALRRALADEFFSGAGRPGPGPEQGRVRCPLRPNVDGGAGQGDRGHRLLPLAPAALPGGGRLRPGPPGHRPG